MTPQEKCVSLNTAQNLEECGLDLETEYLWVCSGSDHRIDFCHRDDLSHFDEHIRFAIPAPDAQEIGEKLPHVVDGYGLGIYKATESGRMDEDEQAVWYVQYERAGVILDYWKGDSEAEARAAAWLYLKEHNLL